MDYSLSSAKDSADAKPVAHICIFLLVCFLLLTPERLKAAPAADFTLSSGQWYQLVIPANTTRLTVQRLFETALAESGYNNTWVIFRWDPVTNQYINPGLSGTIPTGSGFWIIQITGTDVLLNVSNIDSASVIESAACPSPVGCTEIALNTDGNGGYFDLLGSTLPDARQLDSVRLVSADVVGGLCATGCTHQDAVDRDLVEPSVWRYNSASNEYEDLSVTSSLGAWESAWFQINPAMAGATANYLFPATVREPPPASLTDPRVVTIDPLMQQYLGAVSELDRDKFLNMHDNHGDRWRIPRSIAESYGSEFEAGHGRIFWSPMAVGRATISAGGYPSTTMAMQDGPANIRAYNNNPYRGMFAPEQIVVTDHPRAVMTPGNDPVEGARWAADYFTYYFNDESRPRFYEPMNEPFVHADDFQGAYGGSQRNVRAQMTSWFAEIGREFRQRPALEDVKIIGYASAWPSMERFGFGHWNDRMKMFIDEAGPYVDSFSVHLYDGVNVRGSESQRSGSNSQAILDLIETYSLKRLGVVKPHAITEYGSIVDRPAGELAYSDIANSQTIKSFNYIMMELMEREDRILTSIPFITGLSTWYWQDPNWGNGHPYNPAMWRPNRNNIRLVNNRWQFIDANASDNYLLNNNALFFRFWKGVKGNRAKVYVNDPDVQALAFIDDNKAHIVLSNLEAATKTLRLDIAKMLGYNYTSVNIEKLHVPLNAGATLSSEQQTIVADVDGSPQAFSDIVLRDNEFVKLTVTFDKTVVAETTSKRVTYYSDDYLQRIEANTALTFRFSGIDTATTDADYSSAALRLSIGRDHNRSKKPIVTVNGTEISVPDDWAGYDQATRISFFGAIKIPFDRALLQPNTEIEVTFPDAGGHVSSIVMDVNNVGD